MIIEENEIYLETENQLLIFNATEKTNLQLSSVTNITSTRYDYLRDMIKVDNYLYLINGSNLFIYDISITSLPIKLKDISIAKNPRFIIRKENFLFINSYSKNQISVYNITQKDNPTIFTNYYFGGYSNDVKIQDNIAYLANSEDGLRVIDVSAPTKPKEIAHLRTNKSLYYLLIANKILYALTEDSLQIIDVTSPYSPTLISEFYSNQTRSSFREMVIVDNYA
jgi:hypothetical protein